MKQDRAVVVGMSDARWMWGRSSSRKKGLGAMLLVVGTFLVGAAPASAMEWGLNNGNRHYEGSEADWKAMKELGITRYRMELSWNRQAHEGWAYYDSVFTMAAKEGITILPMLYGKLQTGGYPDPSATEHRFPSQGEYVYPPGSGIEQAWEIWAEEAVVRYGYSGTFWIAHPELPYKPVTIWEVWNEPNLGENDPLYWNGKEWINKAQPENYAKFLIATNLAIQHAQNIRGAGTETLFAGLYSAAGMTTPEFLEKAHNVSEAGNAFSALSLHPYPFKSGATVAGYVEEASKKLNKLWPGKSLWITELGWPVVDADPKNHPIENAVQPITQAENLKSSFTWLAQQSNIKYVAWFDYGDWDEQHVYKWALHSGLKDEAGKKRPSWCTYEDIIQVNFCNPYPPLWENDNLGGYINGDPSVSSPGKEKLNVFALGGDGQLWRKWYDPAIGGWSIWYQMFPTAIHGGLTSGPDSASWSANRVDVVARAAEGTVEHWYWDGSAWHVDNLGGYIIEDPTISAPESGKLNVFAKSFEGQLLHKWYDPAIGGWSGWVGMPSVTHGALTSGPDSVSWAPNRVDVVARAGDGTIEHWYWDGSAWHVDNLGGIKTVGAPGITSWESGRLDVFENIEGSPHIKSWIPGVGWTAWEPMYGSISSGIDAASWGKGRIDIVAQAYLGNNSVMHAYTGS